MRWPDYGWIPGSPFYTIFSLGKNRVMEARENALIQSVDELIKKIDTKAKEEPDLANDLTKAKHKLIKNVLSTSSKNQKRTIEKNKVDDLHKILNKNNYNHEAFLKKMPKIELNTPARPAIQALNKLISEFKNLKNDQNKSIKIQQRQTTTYFRY